MPDTGTGRTAGIINNVDVVLRKDLQLGKTLAYTTNGNIISQRTAGDATVSDDDIVLQAAIDATPENGTLLIMPGTYIIGYNASQIDFDLHSMITIFAYGVTCESHSTSHSGFMFRPTGDKYVSGVLDTPHFPTSYAIYGLTVDLKRNWGAAFGCNVDTEHNLIKLVDVTIHNFNSYGICSGNRNNVVNDNSEIYCDNIKIDGGATAITLNECIGARSNGRVTIRNAILRSNKALHLSSRYITLYNVWADGSEYTGLAEMSPINGEFTDCRNIYMRDLALSIRPFLSMDGQSPYGNCRQATIDGYVCVEPSSVFHNLEITGKDGLQIENCTISNFNLSRAPISLQPHSASTAGSIKNLTIENGYINAVTSSHRILSSYNISIENLQIKNIKFGSYSTATEAPIWLQTSLSSKNSDITIGKCWIENINPESTQYIVRAGDNGSGVAKAVTVTMEKPLGNNTKQTITSGPVTLTMKFIENWGKASLSGNASTTVFNIAHGLTAAPSLNAIYVGAGSTDARGNFSISADATNVIVTYPLAPPTGTNNVILYWRARSG